MTSERIPLTPRGVLLAAAKIGDIGGIRAAIAASSRGDFHPQIVIQRPTADICDECFVFANQHKYSKRKKEDAEGKADNSD